MTFETPKFVPLVFRAPPLAMVALTFSTYGKYWFALGCNRWRDRGPRPNAGISVPFILISVLGLMALFHSR